jgi:FlaA1/EpsC-like NDP-sugar epimerase
MLAFRSPVDIVVHAAALKHVPALEYNPFEAVKTNIIGAQNVIESALESGVRKVIALSTDKAAAPINLYGATKLASDKLFVSANHYGGHTCRFSIVRYGNVMGSRGSVVPFFLAERNKGILPITDEEMTRFNITLARGVEFVIECLEQMLGGEIFVPRAPSYRLVDLANAIAPNAKKRQIGLRPGEKRHEELITESDATNTVEFTNSFVIMPNTAYPWFSIQELLLQNPDKLSGKMCADGFRYRSDLNPHFLTIDELRELIIHNVHGGKCLLDIN